MTDRQTIAAVLVVAAMAVPRTLIVRTPVTCPFRRLTGYPCPSCGLTRSWQAAAHLRVRDSLGYHPLGALTLVGAAGIAVDGGSRGNALAQRGDLQAALGAIWIGTWLWRLWRTAATHRVDR